MDAARELVIVAGEHSRTLIVEIRHVEDDETVATVRSSLAADHADRSVLRHLDVVDGARVHPDRVDDLHVAGVRDVPEVGVAVGAVRSGHRVVAPVRTLPDPEVRGGPIGDATLSDDLDLLPDVAGLDGDRDRCGVAAGRRHDRVLTRQVRDEAPIFGDQARARIAEAVVHVAALEGVLDGQLFNGVALRVARGGAEVNHVAGSG